jgi:hypothetical protein
VKWLIPGGEVRACIELNVYSKYAGAIIGIGAGKLISGSQIFHGWKCQLGQTINSTYSWYLIFEIAAKTRT